MTTNKFLTYLAGVRTLVTAIATSAGVGDANKIVATGTDGRLHTSFMPVGIGASTEAIVASEALAAGDFVNIFNNTGTRNCRKADATNNRPAMGFVVASVASAGTATVYLQGLNTAVSGLTPGLIYYLATTAGGSTATAPSTVGQIIQVVGVATSTSAINFEFDEPTVLG